MKDATNNTTYNNRTEAVVHQVQEWVGTSRKPPTAGDATNSSTGHTRTEAVGQQVQEWVGTSPQPREEMPVITPLITLGAPVAEAVGHEAEEWVGTSRQPRVPSKTAARSTTACSQDLRQSG